MSDIIRRRALLGAKSGEENNSMVEYEFPIRGTVDNNGDRYYFGQTNIVDVNWPDGIKYIFKYAFANSRITAGTFSSMPDTVEDFGSYAFYNCEGLSGSIDLPSSLKYVREYSLAYLLNVTAINFKSMTTILGTNAMYHCTDLSTITIPEGGILAVQGNNVFYYSKWLNNKSNGNIYLGKNYIQYKGTMPSNTNLTLDSGTLSIGYGAFQSKSQLKSITIPSTVQYIGPYAFSGCTGLTSITIPESLNSDFYNLPMEKNSITMAGGTAWAGKYSPFYNTACTGITTVNWNAIEGPNGSSTANQNFLGGGTYLPNVTTINFGSEVETIPSYLCYGLKKITSISIPSSVEYIGNYAFGNCTKLTSITIPGTITEFNSSGNILAGCTGLTTLNYNAISAKKVPSHGGTPSINSSYNLWGTLANLTTVNIGNQVQVIPQGFLGSGQSQITSITIPNSVTTIETYAFYGSKLTSIDLPASVTSIGNQAFYSCSSLTSITIRSTTPPTLGSSYSNTFPTTSQNYTIYVPASAVNTYKTTSKWSNWASKIQAIPS